MSRTALVRIVQVRQGLNGPYAPMIDVLDNPDGCTFLDAVQARDLAAQLMAAAAVLDPLPPPETDTGTITLLVAMR